MDFLICFAEDLNLVMYDQQTKRLDIKMTFDNILGVLSFELKWLYSLIDKISKLNDCDTQHGFKTLTRNIFGIK